MPRPDISNNRSAILRLFPSYVYLTTFHVQHLTGRPMKVVERDLKWLRDRGYLNSTLHPEGNFKPRVFYLTQKGWDWGFDQKLFPKEIRAIDEKGNTYLPHDLVITELHIKLHDIYGEDLYWTQLRQFCSHRFGQYQNDRVNMDAFFSIPVGEFYACFALEAEKSRDSVKQKKSARMQKCDAYANYSKGHFQKDFDGDFLRVLWTFENARKSMNHAGKCQELKDKKRHWVLDETLIPVLTREAQAFVTPVDVTYDEKKHRWNAQRLYSLNEA